MVKDPLRNLIIAITGDFGERRGIDKMKQWIHFNDGRFATEISSQVTHLVCSKDHFKKRTMMGMVITLSACSLPSPR